MATAETPSTDAPTTAKGRGWRPYRLSVRQYLRMIEARVIPPNARVELMGGILVEQMTKGDYHNYVIMTLPEACRVVVPPPWLVVNEISLRLGPRSRPEPDVMILQGPTSRYKAQPPAARDVALIVEVAESSYPDDRSRKWRHYASAGIPIYWIINLSKRQVEVFRDPVGAGVQAAYQTSEIFGEDAAVPVLIAGLEVGRISVRDILP